MNKRCKHAGSNGFHRCGSYAFNLALEKDGIEQGDLCDVHYWQDQALSARAKLAEQPARTLEELYALSREVSAEQPAPVQKPLGYIATMALNDLQASIYGDVAVYGKDSEDAVAIYTTPQAQRKPLTDEQIHEMANDFEEGYVFLYRSFARAIEAAHGIKENT